MASKGGKGAVPGTVRGGCPDMLLRRFDVYFAPRTKMLPLPMRGVRASHLGHLVRVRVRGVALGWGAGFAVVAGGLGQLAGRRASGSCCGPVARIRQGWLAGDQQRAGHAGSSDIDAVGSGAGGGGRAGAGPDRLCALHCLVRQGVVTHVTDVKPLVSVVAYTDPETGFEVYQEVTGRTFKPLDNDSKEVRQEGRVFFCKYQPRYQPKLSQDKPG